MHGYNIIITVIYTNARNRWHILDSPDAGLIMIEGNFSHIRCT